MSNIENLTNNQIKALILYEEMFLNKVGKTKLNKYKAIGEQLETPTTTVKTWITRYYENYIEFKKELPKKTQKKDSKRLNLEGLTGLELRYIKARLSGFGKEEAKEHAGYSENTKAVDIEKQPNVARTLEEIRKDFLTDEKHGVEAVIKAIDKVQLKAEEYKTEDMLTTRFTTTDGKDITRTIKKTNAFGVELAALKMKMSILGYDPKSLNIKQQSTDEEGNERVEIIPRRKTR
ncbi:hypothetical protein H3N56_02560 [Cetobacterium sp. 2A]|uniref:hypothetical protein n=1 Tax=Cetobacterium sp. 2A TaxID=2754723 RepID=UPI00163CEFA8|nr:hypothetical protein [Cetobacterium sp. 2A]MBC2855375.1 hypothetical protein [Cetobacterium sp. 2A]